MNRIFQKIVQGILLAVFSIGFFVADGHALRSYRCYGRVQYRPCTSVNSQGQSHAAKVASRTYAKVLRSEFSELPAQEGIWRGSIAGNGTVHLRLVIKKNGIIQSSRYMGNIALADKSTTFAFRSVTPPGDDWSWDIVAYNG